MKTTKLLGVSLVFGLLSMTTAFASDPNFGIVPPNASYQHKTYGEWSAEFWQWLYRLPVERHPLFDWAECGQGQVGQVWFLGGTYTTNPEPDGSVLGKALRYCAVPDGKALFIPIINAECSEAEGNGTTDGALRSCATLIIDHAQNLSAEVDGTAIPNLGDYRAQSPLFEFTLPKKGTNVLQATGVSVPPGTTSPAVSDGFYLLLSPLAKGNHTIHVSGDIVYQNPPDAFDFTFKLDVTYHLRVQ